MVPAFLNLWWWFMWHCSVIYSLHLLSLRPAFYQCHRRTSVPVIRRHDHYAVTRQRAQQMRVSVPRASQAMREEHDRPSLRSRRCGQQLCALEDRYRHMVEYSRQISRSTVTLALVAWLLVWARLTHEKNSDTEAPAPKKRAYAPKYSRWGSGIQYVFFWCFWDSSHG